MLIEIRGTGFVNKGAELMLCAIIAKLREEMPKAKLVMAPNWGSASYLKRSQMGLYQKIWLQRYGIQWGYFGALIPKKLRQMYGMVLDAEVDVVIDASGFAYSDQWGAGTSVTTAKAIRKWKKQGAKVIFMPQAFGPFTDAKIKDAFKILVEHADLMFARDVVSYGSITALAGNRQHVKIAPDFTNLIEGELPKDFDNKNNQFCIIPNYRMIDKTQKKESQGYIPFLITCIKYLQKKGVNPFILIHEGDTDLWLAEEVIKNFGHDINIVHETNALRIKGIIGSSIGVISSRFHGLVSALSQGVPSLATGWSHKYKMLFRDYDFEEGLMDVMADDESIYEKINLIVEPGSKQEIESKIIVKSEELKKKSEGMWSEIFKVLGVF